jgi:hypothetical protein
MSGHKAKNCKWLLYPSCDNCYLKDEEDCNSLSFEEVVEVFCRDCKYLVACSLSDSMCLKGQGVMK